MKKTIEYLQQQKKRGRKLAALTCYDYPTALCLEAAGLDIALIGDSVGTNVLGYQSEQEVRLSDIEHHLRAVCRGVKSAYVLADLPHLTYETPEQALKNAQIL